MDHTRRVQMITETIAIKAMKDDHIHGGEAENALVDTALEQLKAVTEIAVNSIKAQP